MLAWTPLVAIATLAHAQTRDAAAGEALFQEGRRLMKAGDFASACAKLDESLRLDPALGTLVNLAACEEQLGRTATAWEHWRAAADQLASSDRRRATAVSRAAALEKTLARLTVSLASDTAADVEVRRDGVRLRAASLGLPLPVDPGRHVVVVSAAGHEPREYELTVRPRENRSLAVDVGPTLPAPATSQTAPPTRTPPPPSDTPAERRVGIVAPAGPAPARSTAPSRTIAWGMLGGAAVAAGVAVYGGVQALGARSDARSSCRDGDAGRLCWSSAAGALDRDHRWSLVADVGAGAAAALAGAGLYLLYRERPSREVAFLLSPTPTGAAATVAARF